MAFTTGDHAVHRDPLDPFRWCRTHRSSAPEIRGEVAALRLEHVDPAGGTLRVGRLKRSQPQVYPLVAPVADAIRDYLDVRPRSPHLQVFLGLKAPRTPLTSSAIYDLVNRRIDPMKLELEPPRHRLAVTT